MSLDSADSRAVLLIALHARALSAEAMPVVPAERGYTGPARLRHTY